MKSLVVYLMTMMLVALNCSAEGVFRLGKVNGRDCLVDPAGKPFLSLGVNHIQNVVQGGFSGDRQKAYEEAYENLKAWGFNTGGYGTPEPLTKIMPYLAPMYLTMNANYMSNAQFSYPDIFDPAVQDEIRRTIRHEIGKQQGNPNLIGYYWTDTPQWDMARARKTRGTDWVSTIRKLPDSAPGKQRYKQFLADGGTEDYDFLRLIARELYKVLGDETKRLAPGVLIFGERYLFDDHPDCVVEEALPYIDVLSIQPGGAKFRDWYFDELHTKFKKPIMLCDHQSSFPTPVYPNTMWQQMESEAAAGQAYAQYLKEAFDKPYIIGFQRCQYIDRFEKHLGILKQGMIREDGTSYKTLAEYVTEANRAAVEQLMKHKGE
jgi:hypothetical protein